MKLLDWTHAAEYCGLGDDIEYFRGLVTNGRGPEFVKPSPRRIYFTPDSLDAWMGTWKRGKLFDFGDGR